MNVIRYFLALFCAIMLINGVGLGQSIQISTTNAFFCIEGNVSVNYALTGLFSYDNVFTAQLSDSSGQFNLPVNIGSSPGNSSGMIQAQMPSNLSSSGNYKIRVVANNPSTISENVINAPIQNTILDSWVRRADVGTIPKSYGTGFAIENKLYFGTGANANYTTNDFWEYNPTNNVWTRKQNLPIIKSASVGFSIGNKGYFCGGNGLADLWEYNPQLNTWSQKANLGGAGRLLASAFVIGGTGYVGLGKSNTGQSLNDFWAYDQANNTWTRKADFPGEARYGAVGLTIINKGYFGFGISGAYKKDFWEYNPELNSWTQKANCIGSPRLAPSSFAIQGKGYVGLGYQNSNKRDFFEYNQQTNTWQQLRNFTGTARRSSTALSIGNKAFVISGIGNSGSTNDLWEYTASTQLIQIDSVQRINCQGTSLPISYKIGCNNFASDNVFNVQLSDTTGSFEDSQTIGTLNATGSGIINASIASNALFSKRYMIRIVSSNPQSVSAAFSISILPRNTVQLTSAIGSNYQNICIESPMSPITYSVYGISNIQADSLPIGVTANLTDNTITISGSTSSVRDNNYAIKLLGGCISSTVTGSINVKPLTSIVTQPSNSRQQICQFSDANQLSVYANGFNLSYQWYASNDSSNQTGTIIPGADSSVLIPSSNLVNTQYYYCIVNGICGLPVTSKVSGRHKITESGSWLGFNQNWNDAQNWCGGVPQNTANAIIPSGSTNYPVISNVEASCNNLIVNTGATLVLNDQTLNIAGTINNSGTINAINGSINLNGTAAAQAITPSKFYKNKIKNLKISNNNGVSIIGVNDTLMILGDLSFGKSNCTLQTNNNIAMVSDSTKTGNISDMTSDGVNTGVYSGNKIIGNVTVERYVPNHYKAWQFLSTPTSGQTIKDAWQEGNAALVNGKPGYGTTLVSNLPNALSPSLGFDFYSPNGSTIKTYNATSNAWEGVSSTFNSINNPKGYALYVRGDRSVTAYNQPATSTILRTSGIIYQPINPPPTISVVANKFESVGNPYASAIDLSKLIRTGGVQDVYYVWDPKLSPTYYGGGYRTLVRVGDGYIAVPSDDNPSSYYHNSNQNINIQSGQAFFVRADSALGDGTLSFNENCKVKNDAIVIRTTAESVKKIFVNLNRETTVGSVLLDGVISLFDETYQNELNYSDASKLFIGSSEGLAIIRNNKTLAAEKRALPQVVDTIFYKLNQLRNLQYNLSIKFENFEDSILKPFLVDRYTGVQQMLLFNSSNVIQFAVTSDALSANPNRFYLTFKPMQTVPVKFTSITAENVSKNINKINWKVENEINVFHYDIEKSIDGRSFVSIGNQVSMYNNGQSGTYQFVDTLVASNIVFYRVKSIDLDGSHSYSNIVRLSDLGNKNKLYVSPNPVENKIINLYFKNQPKGKYVVSILDAKGQQLKSTQYTLTETDKILKILAKEILNAGAYFLKIDGPNNSKSVIPVVIQ